jgi:hypothetical protein
MPPPVRKHTIGPACRRATALAAEYARHVGQACDADTAVPPAGGPGKIAVVARGVCTFQEKYDNVVAAGGYEALLVANRENAGLGDGCDTLSMLVSGDTLPAFFIPAPRRLRSVRHPVQPRNMCRRQ